MTRAPARALLAAVAMAATAAVPAGVPAAAQAPPPPVAAVRLPFPVDDGSLAPTTFELGYPLVTLVYDTLLWRDAEGVPQPWLARSVEAAGDGRRLTVVLADGATWHDGRPLTADDVVFTMEFFARRFHPRFSPPLEAVDTVVAVDRDTVVISLRHPALGFPDQPLADLPILPRHLWEALPQSATAPPGPLVGSGPYRLTEHVPGVRYRFEANPAYFRGRPAVAAVEVPVIGEVEATLRALERREVDMIPVSLPAGAGERLEGLGVELLTGPSYLGTTLVFNLRRPPFDDRAARRAVAAALDLERILDAVGPGETAGRGYLHPASPWASPKVLHTTDEAGAARALAALDAGPLTVLAPDNDPVKAEAARQVALALRRAGVAAERSLVPPADLARALGSGASAPSFQLAVTVTPPLASYDPAILGRLFGSARGPGSLNLTGYASAEFDGLAARIVAAATVAERGEAVHAALRLLAADAPAVPLFFATGTFAYRPAIHDGWVFVKGTGILDKRSFLERAGPRDGGESGPAPVAGSDRSVPLGWIALALLAAALVVGAVALARRE